MVAIQLSAFAQTASIDPKQDLRNDLLSFVALASDVTSHLAQTSSKESLQYAIASLQSQSEQLVRNTEKIYEINEDWMNEYMKDVALFTVLRPEHPATASFFMGQAYNVQANPYPTAPQYYLTLKDVSGYFAALAKAKAQKKVIRLNRNVQRELDDLSSKM
jgi:DNA-binding transcriptional regulator GbsR (MarR family)